LLLLLCVYFLFRMYIRESWEKLRESAAAPKAWWWTAQRKWRKVSLRNFFFLPEFLIFIIVKDIISMCLAEILDFIHTDTHTHIYIHTHIKWETLIIFSNSENKTFLFEIFFNFPKLLLRYSNCNGKKRRKRSDKMSHETLWN
jgi:hypothetical protein